MGIIWKKEWDEGFSRVTITRGGRGTHQRELGMELKVEPGPSNSDHDGTLIKQAMEALRGAMDNLQAQCRLLQCREIKRDRAMAAAAMAGAPSRNPNPSSWFGAPIRCSSSHSPPASGAQSTHMAERLNLNPGDEIQLRPGGPGIFHPPHLDLYAAIWG